VYDITGRRVATLKNQMEEAGYYQIRWDGKNISDKPLSSGMYIIQMTAKSMEDGELFTKAQKVVLLK
jgi:flagellar hook assembly protein FlgD